MGDENIFNMIWKLDNFYHREENFGVALSHKTNNNTR